MTTKVTWIGHGTFQIETGGKTLIIDPFFNGNPAAAVKEEDVSPDVIIVTHGHGDHVGDTISIAQRTGALVISNFEITEWLQKQGVSNVHPLHIGGSHAFDFGRVKLTIAHHGSMLPDGSNGGNPCGVLLKLNDGTIYHAGDTGLFYD
ncbi:MAG TPA: metal-dependent hydrolase, partial [Planctomycetaceae bacterium]|nr:metal-dependent hydrolase [Planctomycetaceae bacterium]